MTTAVQQRRPLMLRLRNTAPARALVPLARGAINACVENYLKINTRDYESPDASGAGHFGDSNYYDALDYPLLSRYLAALELRADDVAYEIGCGLGRAVCVMARYPLRKCVGVELSEPLAEGARRNLERVRGRRAQEVAIVAGDAAFVDYSDATAIYMFNPFGPTTMSAVLGRVRESLASRPRSIRILYVNPIHEDVFEQSGWLRLARRLRSPWFNTPASLWVHDTCDDGSGSSGGGDGTAGTGASA